MSSYQDISRIVQFCLREINERFIERGGTADTRLELFFDQNYLRDEYRFGCKIAQKDNEAHTVYGQRSIPRSEFDLLRGNSQAQTQNYMIVRDVLRIIVDEATGKYLALKQSVTVLDTKNSNLLPVKRTIRKSAKNKKVDVKVSTRLLRV